jgi:hypothetical protein
MKDTTKAFLGGSVLGYVFGKKKAENQTEESTGGDTGGGIGAIVIIPGVIAAWLGILIAPHVVAWTSALAAYLIWGITNWISIISGGSNILTTAAQVFEYTYWSLLSLGILGISLFGMFGEDDWAGKICVTIFLVLIQLPQIWIILKIVEIWYKKY